MGDYEAMTKSEMDGAIRELLPITMKNGRSYPISKWERRLFIAGMRAAETLAADVGPDGYKSYQAINLAIRELEKP